MHRWMQMIHDASALDFSLSLTFILVIHTWSPASNWPCKLLGNSLLFRTEFIPIRDYRAYFP